MLKSDLGVSDSSIEIFTEDWWTNPINAVDGLVGVSDGLQLQLDLPDGGMTQIGLNLDYLVRWYAMIAQGRLGTLPFALGYGDVRHDESSETVRCDLTRRTLWGDEESVIHPGPTLVGSRPEHNEMRMLLKYPTSSVSVSPAVP